MKKYNWETISTGTYKGKHFCSKKRFNNISKIKAYFSILFCETILFFKGYKKIKIELINKGVCLNEIQK